MDIWTYLEYEAWTVSFVLAVWMLYDWIRTDRAYGEDVLTSSREGEIEALTEQVKL